MAQSTKRKVNAKEVVGDIRAGFTDLGIMEKFDLDLRGLQLIFRKLVESGLIAQSELEERRQLHDRSISLEVFRCPHCNMPQFTRFDECPQCGVIVSKVNPPPKQEDVPPPTAKASDQALNTSPGLQSPPIAPLQKTPSQGEDEIDTSEWMQYETKNRDTPIPTDLTTKKGQIKITVSIRLDLLNELNSLDGDLSERVSEAVELYLAKVNKNE